MDKSSFNAVREKPGQEVTKWQGHIENRGIGIDPRWVVLALARNSEDRLAPEAPSQEAARAVNAVCYYIWACRQGR